MTLFTAFYVPDGIVVVSDSRITENIRKEDGSEKVKILSDEAQKIFLLRNRDVGLVYTAEDMPEGFTMNEFVYNINKFVIKSTDSIYKITLKIKHYINDIGIRKISIVIAGFDQEEPYAYLIENKEMKILNREKGKILYIATVGGNLKRVDEFFNYERFFDDFSIEDALEYGKSLVKDSVDYLNNLDEYSNVGGDIQYLVLNKTGGANLVR